MSQSVWRIEYKDLFASADDVGFIVNNFPTNDAGNKFIISKVDLDDSLDAFDAGLGEVKVKPSDEFVSKLRKILEEEGSFDVEIF